MPRPPIRALQVSWETPINPKLPTKGPLEGIKILDCTIWQNGPLASVMLGDMGADIIKVEEPKKGDPSRRLVEIGSPPSGVGAYFEANNRNKRSMSLNLKSEAGIALFYRLVKNTDIVMHNFKVGVAERLGIDHSSLTKHNKKIITAVATGLGKKGDDAKLGVFDILGLARSGAMHALRYPGCDYQYTAAFGLADQVGALVLAQGITLALLARERFDIGQEIEASQLGSMMLLQQMGITRQLINGIGPTIADRTQNVNPLFSVYPGSGDRWFAIGGLQPDRYWKDFCLVIGRSDIVFDKRFEDMSSRTRHAAELVAILDTIFIKKPREYWLSQLAIKEIPCAPINDYNDLKTDCQVVANQYITQVEHPGAGTISAVGLPIKLSETPGEIQSTAPEFGQHTEILLLEEGLSWEEINELKEKNAI